jgi:hypothetical protein
MVIYYRMFLRNISFSVSDFLSLIQMMRKLSIALIFVFLSCKSPTPGKSIWTKDYEQTVYNNIDASIKLRIPDELRRKELVTYVVKRLKSELPGGMKSVSDDSVYRLSVKIGAEYGYAHAQKQDYETGITPALRPWTPELEQVLREAIFTGEKKEDHQRNQSLCDCTIRKLRAIFPDSVMIPLPRHIIVAITKTCQDKIASKVK